jgi:alkanesulfonate monooxygenase SsuD/methylene tetrahydromethanopterin reductase-like flavin-dependent oxidoreductase (luciferase family)
VDGRLRLGLELPNLGFDGAPEAQVGSVLEVAQLAEAGGVGTLWLVEAEAEGTDPAPLLGAIADATSAMGLGMMVRPSRGRHPSVLARDVTAIDILSSGRAAVAVVEDGGGPLDLERVADAASILHRLFTEEDVTVAGRFYEVAELTTRPRAVTPGGPPVVAGLVGGAIATDDAPEAVLAATSVQAVVTGGPPSQVGASRSRLDGAATADSLPALVWRGPFDDQGPRAALDQGADGVIAVLAPSARRRNGLDRAAVADAIEGLARLER